VFPLIQPMSGPVNGANTIFETPTAYVPGSVRVFINGQLKRVDLEDGWTELGGRRVRLKEAPLPAPGSVDVVQAYYIPL